MIYRSLISVFVFLVCRLVAGGWKKDVKNDVKGLEQNMAVVLYGQDTLDSRLLILESQLDILKNEKVALENLVDDLAEQVSELKQPVVSLSSPLSLGVFTSQSTAISYFNLNIGVDIPETKTFRQVPKIFVYILWDTSNRLCMCSVSFLLGFFFYLDNIVILLAVMSCLMNLNFYCVLWRHYGV